MDLFHFRKPIFALLSAILLLSSCKQARKKMIQSPPGYNFSQVFTSKLDLKLREISGLVWDTRNNEILAHNDESGKIFVLDKENKAIKTEFVFGERGDYEDIALYKGVIYVLRSDGQLTRITRDSEGKFLGTDAGKLGVTGSVDFETLYADTARRALILICKNCGFDDKKTVSAFAYYPDSIGFVNQPVFTIDAAAVAAKSPHKTSKFQPSAAAIHPVLKKLFILSSAANQLVIADLDGKVESVYELGKKLFPQPEGITFKSNGDMYISNEGVSSRGVIHRFEYKP